MFPKSSNGYSQMNDFKPVWRAGKVYVFACLELDQM